jgi:predicted Rossmann fold flavoprotein
MAARHAAEGGADVVLFESTRDGGRKILISGGGRCNVLPSVAAPERYVTQSSPRVLRRMLRSWPLDEQRHFFENELGIPLRLEPETGKLFPASNRARDVRDRLVSAAMEAGVRIRFSTRVDGLRAPASDGQRWRVHLEGGETVAVDRVVVATGGLSVPKTGSDGAGLGWMRSLGHELNDPYPALTPLTGPPDHAELAGVSLEVTVRAPGARPRFSTTGGFLFTHRGYSGPTVLDASHLAILSARESDRQALTVQWSPLDEDGWEDALLGARSGAVGPFVSSHLPSRLARRLTLEADVPWDRGLARLTRDERRRLVVALTAYELPWTGDEGYKKAEVTGGGVALDQVDPNTLESRRAPGLFLCGEILDAFGPIGGHNFLWAWATGRAAGRASARAIDES